MSKTNWILILLITVISCNEQNEFEYPLVFTGDVINITDTSATFTAKISNPGKYPILESGFIWGVHSNDNYGIKIRNEGIPDGVYALQTNYKLLPGKTYYVRAYVLTESTVTYGREVTFNSLEGQVELGKWSLIINDGFDNSGRFVSVESSFTINDTTYFATYGSLYCFSHISNTFSFVLANPILLHADISVVFNGYVYIFHYNAFYRFDPKSKSFNKLSVLNEDVARINGSGFLINDKIYIGLGEGSSKFWKYIITEDSWQQIASFPGSVRRNAFNFSINNVGYIGGGFNFHKFSTKSDFWCYNPENDQWIRKENLPIVNEDMFDLVGDNTENFGYCFYKNKLYEYNPVFNIWGKMADLNNNRNLGYPHLFAVKDKIYLMASKYDDNNRYFIMWVYEK